MLQQQFLPAFQTSVPENKKQVMYFQQDGCPAHYALIVRQWLDDKFPDRWIGRRGPLFWPARSPDLTSMGTCLWGYLKEKIFVPYQMPQTLLELKNKVLHHCRVVNDNKDLLHNVIENWTKHVNKCFELRDNCLNISCDFPASAVYHFLFITFIMYFMFT